MKADMLKKLLQAGALAAEAGSRGSAGNIASKIVDSELDLSGFRKRKKESNGKAPGPNAEEKKKVLNPTTTDPYGENKTNYYA